MSIHCGARKIAFALVLMLAPVSVLADWYVSKVYVKRVDVFEYQGTSVSRVIYEVVPGISSKDSFGCQPNDELADGVAAHYQAAYWSGAANDTHPVLVGQLLSAKAQKVPVDIFFEPSGCNKQHSYGYGGLGRQMTGVSISSD